MPFLTSATPGTFLNQTRVEVTTERTINPERESCALPPFDRTFHSLLGLVEGSLEAGDKKGEQKSRF